MAKSSTLFPSGPKKKLVAGLFNTPGLKHSPPDNVQRGVTEAHSGQPRKNGAPHTKG